MGQLNRFRVVAWTVLAINVVVIAWGAVVRATGSGAGCGSDWPTCKGDVLPSLVEAATAIEFVHRLSSAAALLGVLVLLILSLRTYPRGHLSRNASVAAMVFIVIEALIGAALVLFELVASNASVSRSIVMPLHLINTLLLLGALMLAIEASSSMSLPTRKLRWRRQWPVALGLIAAALIAATGAIAALGDTLFPAESLRQGLTDDLHATSPLLVQLRVVHPAFAGVAGAYLLILAHWLSQRGIRRGALLLAILVTVQLGLGLVNLALLAPLGLQIAHLVLADILWIVLVHVSWQAWQASTTHATRAEGRDTRERTPNTALTSPLS